MKCGWFWTLLLLSGFVYITSNTYSCGKMSVVKNQVSRLVFATMVWFSITSLFNSIEAKTGLCEVTRSVLPRIEKFAEYQRYSVLENVSNVEYQIYSAHKKYLIHKCQIPTNYFISLTLVMYCKSPESRN